MEILSLSFPPPLVPPQFSNNNINNITSTYCISNNPIVKVRNNCKTKYGVKNRQLSSLKPVKSVLNDVSVTAAEFDPAQAQLSWEIIVGSLAGVIPFVVAGIEFSKRIVAQRQCKVCGGSGLVLRDKKYYFRCPSCGGFLPWQSWKRFFSG